MSDGAENNMSPTADVQPSEPEVSSMNIEVPDTSSVDLALDDADDGVLDLTADMRVATPVVDSGALTSQQQENIDINIGEELSAVSSEMPVPDVSIEMPVPTAPAEVSSVDLSAELSSVNNPLELSASPVMSIPTDEEVSDPIYTPEEDDNSQSLYAQADSIINDIPDVSPIVSDFNIETIPTSENSDPVFMAQEDIVAADEIVAEPENDVADVSAQIINNFAKIFAGAQEPVETPTPQVSSQIKLGPDATIYDMVQNSIRDMLSPNMIKDIVSEADIKDYASEQVAQQVKAWLNHNLPTMVETIVKKEIERVMVKAGKN